LIHCCILLDFSLRIVLYDARIHERQVAVSCSVDRFVSCLCSCVTGTIQMTEGRIYSPQGPHVGRPWSTERFRRFIYGNSKTNTDILIPINIFICCPFIIEYLIQVSNPKGRLSLFRTSNPVTSMVLSFLKLCV
jgi:hypothetical protein